VLIGSCVVRGGLSSALQLRPVLGALPLFYSPTCALV